MMTHIGIYFVFDMVAVGVSQKGNITSNGDHQSS